MHIMQAIGHCRGITVPFQAVGIHGINLEEFPQRINVTPVTAYHGIQAHLNVRGIHRGKPLQNTTGEKKNSKNKKPTFT